VTLRCPYIFNLRMDPYEHAQITSNTYYDWMFRHIYLLVPAQALVAEFLNTFKEFPPRQKAASFRPRSGDRQDGGGVEGRLDMKAARGRTPIAAFWCRAISSTRTRRGPRFFWRSTLRREIAQAHRVGVAARASAPGHGARAERTM
jgi:hypothetical protein